MFLQWILEQNGCYKIGSIHVVIIVVKTIEKYNLMSKSYTSKPTRAIVVVPETLSQSWLSTTIDTVSIYLIT